MAVLLAGLVAMSACARDDMANGGAEAPAATATSETTASRDARITTAIQGRFFESETVKPSQIAVIADDGTVTLRGSVASQEAKDEAVRLARGVEGVGDVHDELTIDPSRSAAAAPRQDAADAGWIATKIQAQYFVNPDIKPWNIDVSVSDNGTVTLAGTVDSSDDRDRAVQIARQTEGVTGVNDELRVSGETVATTGERGDAAASAENAMERAADAVSDAWVTAKIQSKYFIDDEIKGRNIDVETNNGVVTVAGTVGSYDERRQAVAMARSTDGVREVRDQLRVDASIERPDGQPVNDAWITTKLQSRFFLDDQLRPSDVDVETENGVVMLSGTVRSPAVRQAAEEIARDTQGVSRVVNNISVSQAESRGGAAGPEPAPPASSAPAADAPATPGSQTPAR
jgi:osmotically-inducible protein OsmY